MHLLMSENYPTWGNWLFARYGQSGFASLLHHRGATTLVTLKSEYENYLRHQRGLSDRTIYHCWRFAERFITFRFKGKKLDFGKVKPTDIVDYMLHLTTRKKPFRDKTPPTHLRNFFRFLFYSGRTEVNLAPSVPRVAQRHSSNLPRYLSLDQVERLLAALKKDTPIGRRNYAMVLLLARLAMRAQEVVAIQIDDIDWRAGEILVRGKGKHRDRLPLPQDVGEAIADYVRRDRKTISRTLFVTNRQPSEGFVDAQVLNGILETAFGKTGIKPPTRYVGSHILRHSLATDMVSKGASLDEVGDMLRHRGRRSTMIYAKIDVEGLRSVARAWPAAGGAK
jgi:integrase/recombinase XerD